MTIQQEIIHRNVRFLRLSFPDCGIFFEVGRSGFRDWMEVVLEGAAAGVFLVFSEESEDTTVDGMEVGASGVTPLETPLTPMRVLRGRVNLSVNIFLEEAE